MLARYKAEQPITYTRAEAGTLPAEVLTPHGRRLLVRQLVADGMTNRVIAEHTRWSLYTTARIRDSIHLRPNIARTECEAA
ncbi:hypothetical protein [Nocardia sp. NPDC051570]|uniref:hypothetical protein n=1 Tax=Nocardia sp. NPDC051570 TaxID=3364324 RepID=UPI0037B21399